MFSSPSTHRDQRQIAQRSPTRTPIILAVKANQPTLRAEIQSAFVAAGPTRSNVRRLRQGRRPHRTTDRQRPQDVERLNGDRRFPASIVSRRWNDHSRPVARRLSGRSRFDTPITFCRPPRPHRARPRPCAPTGASKTASTGSSNVDFHEYESRRDGDGARAWPSSDIC